MERRSSIFPPNSKFLRPSVLDLLVQLGQTDWQTGGRTALFRSTSPQGGRIKGNNTVSFTCRRRPSKLVTIVSIVPSITHNCEILLQFSRYLVPCFALFRSSPFLEVGFRLSWLISCLAEIAVEVYPVFVHHSPSCWRKPYCGCGVLFHGFASCIMQASAAVASDVEICIRTFRSQKCLPRGSRLLTFLSDELTSQCRWRLLSIFVLSKECNVQWKYFFSPSTWSQNA